MKILKGCSLSSNCTILLQQVYTYMVITLNGLIDLREKFSQNHVSTHLHGFNILGISDKNCMHVLSFLLVEKNHVIIVSLMAKSECHAILSFFHRSLYIL